ncbi:hypothetical protein [Bradyrhizobium altum]|uniref:hypothetical protein n=1 Tax=Bradyrhizobium altum TaxID=1571202 RepID=UPI001E5236E2|nr:hypothetical protein [Bradyrhizobium altum]
MKSTASPSTLKGTPPKNFMLKPVAVTMMSASRRSPPVSWMPVASKRSMVSVTTDALPLRMAANRSPSGMTAMRCCQGR